jgi:hypothetical protein
MSVINDIKHLVSNSRLFVKAEMLQGGKGKKRGAGGKGRRGGPVKIGQGGTLDPLADGVMGKYDQILLLIHCSFTCYFSRWRWERHKKIV